MHSAELNLKCINNIWFVENSENGHWGKGATTADAIENLRLREAEHLAFQKDSGFAPVDSLGAQFALTRWWGKVWPTFRILLILSLLCIPLKLAIQTGVSRGVKNGVQAIDTDGLTRSGSLWTKIDKLILDAGDEKYALNDKEKQKLNIAIQRIKKRYDIAQ